MEELRCDSKKYGEYIPETGLLEIKCNSKFCGAGNGIIVIHRFDVLNGMKLVDTKRFRQPKEG